MNAAEHLAEAERLLAEVNADGRRWDDDDQLTRVLVAQGHALIAIADGLGIAHAVPAGG